MILKSLVKGHFFFFLQTSLLPWEFTNKSVYLYHNAHSLYGPFNLFNKSITGARKKKPSLTGNYKSSFVKHLQLIKTCT